jgi:hypothetical protein
MRAGRRLECLTGAAQESGLKDGEVSVIQPEYTSKDLRW